MNEQVTIPLGLFNAMASCFYGMGPRHKETKVPFSPPAVFKPERATPVPVEYPTPLFKADPMGAALDALGDDDNADDAQSAN